MLNNKTVLFIGDSITDAFRTSVYDQCLELGAGYPLMIASEWTLEHPGSGTRFLNRGVSGNRVTDLYARWEEDVIKLRPDILSILVGVNDIWHEFQDGTGVSLPRFHRTYLELLRETREALPDCEPVLLEPFILPCGVVAENLAAWQGQIAGYRDCVRELAQETGCKFVPLQEPLTRAAELAPPSCWLVDGVHPVGAGHALIAREWMRVVAP